MDVTLSRNHKEPSSSYKLATKVLLGGKIVFLPNERVPLVVQILTLSQIAAIPRDKYVIELIGPARTFNSSSVRRRFNRRVGSKGRVYFHRPPSKIAKARIGGEQEFVTATKLVDKFKEYTEKLFYENRELKRNQNDAPPSDSGIFNPAIDEGKLSDCILEIITHIFGDTDKARICGSEYKVVEFCLLMHYYFIRIKFLKNTARKPFCEYLEKMVFTNNQQFTVKTFNNFAIAPNYAKEAEGFKSEKKKKIDFSTRPQPNGTLIGAFQEIGWNFHYSKYFDELRELRNNLNNFRI